VSASTTAVSRDPSAPPATGLTSSCACAAVSSLRVVRLAFARACVILPVLAVLALLPASAQAHDSWVHGTVVGCQCHFTGLVDAACTTSCHVGFASVPGQKCWSCHAPGSDTSLLSSNEACRQECHLFAKTTYSWGYWASYQHTAEPHFGADPVYGECLDCHALGGPTGESIESSHHSGLTLEAPTCGRCHDGVVASKQGNHGPHECLECHTVMDRPEMPANCVACHTERTANGQECQECHLEHIHTGDVGTCRACHGTYYRHALAAVDCEKCHREMALFHHGWEVIGAKTCRLCHARGHDGTRVPGSKCKVCHTGPTPLANPTAQHSRRVSNRLRCRTCHSTKVVHARAYRPKYTCRTCHKSRMHSLQKIPTNAICLNCHPRAVYHTGPFKCVLCHRRAVHDRTP
jgi:hypothetical protein